MKNLIILMAIVLVFMSVKPLVAQTEVKKHLVPTVTKPAPPGSRGFGMPKTPKPGTNFTSPPRRLGGSSSVTEPREFKTMPSESPLPFEMVANQEMTYGLKLNGWVTDGPELYRTKIGKLYMLWASWGANRYLQCVAYSDSGTIDGPWIQADKPLIGNNSGHGIIFTSFEGKRLFIVHHAEGDGPRKPQIWELDDSGDKVVLGKRYL